MRKREYLIASLAMLLLLVLSGCKGNKLPDGMDEDKVSSAGLAVMSQLTKGEYEEVYDALREDVREQTSADAIEEDIDNDVNYFLVFLGSSLIGYFAWKMENTSLHLLHLYLKPEYRGKAIGRDIVASCERLARGEGRGRVWCGVNAKALPVQQFFKARGYRSLGPAESEGGIERNELIFERML